MAEWCVHNEPSFLMTKSNSSLQVRNDFCNSRDVGDWSSTPARGADRCPRCGGLMVHEWGENLTENTAQRCVQCGELVDSVIVENRRLQQTGALDSK